MMSTFVAEPEIVYVPPKALGAKPCAVCGYTAVRCGNAKNPKVGTKEPRTKKEKA